MHDEDDGKEDDENEKCPQTTMLDSSDGFEFAPGEGQIPLPLLMDEDCEELAFPTIFGGQARKCNPAVKMSYEDQVYSELRRSDRRATRDDHLFFVHKKSQCRQLQRGINIALKKSAQNSRITATQALDKTTIAENVSSDNAYRFLSAITGSPPYFEKVKKNVLAMVRQLGIFTLFVTLTAAETHWMELLKILKKTVDKEEDADVSNLDWTEKTRLIQSDPATCALYFDHRHKELVKTWNVKDGPFGEHEVVHRFYRIEFQHRGSPHVHMILWLKNAPIFNPEEPASFRDVENFIDKIITTSSDDISCAEYLKYQNHKCTRTCNKKKKGTRETCRFGAPFKPLPRTMILVPLNDNEKEAITKERQAQIRDLLKRVDDLLNDDPSKIQSFEEMLEILGCSEKDYIEAIRSGLKANKIFLKRAPKDCRLNAYNPKILSLMRSNMDIQFVLDPYACIGYIVDYINKSSRGLSLMLHTWLQEFKKGDSGLRKQLKGLANVFWNGSEVSAQEAAWIRLRLPMSFSTDAVEFINTSPKDKRHRMLKSEAELKELDPDSTDVMKTGVIERYADRPDELENICLAEFVAWYTFKGSSSNKSSEECFEEGHHVEEEISGKHFYF